MVCMYLHAKAIPKNKIEVYLRKIRSVLHRSPAGFPDFHSQNSGRILSGPHPLNALHRTVVRRNRLLIFRARAHAVGAFPARGNQTTCCSCRRLMYGYTTDVLTTLIMFSVSTTTPHLWLHTLEPSAKAEMTLHPRCQCQRAWNSCLSTTRPFTQDIILISIQIILRS